MILWIIKQLLSLRKAVLGRAQPSELAWGLAIGAAIGLIPKGNLVSLLLIASLVSLRVNHGMAALAAVGCSFLAGRFDPWTHELGNWVLGAEQVRPFMERIWNWPLMPWTDLNNTVVMGSTLVAGASLVPTYALSLPLFHWLAQRTGGGTDAGPEPSPENAAKVAASELETYVPEVVPGSSQPLAPVAVPAESPTVATDMVASDTVGLEEPINHVETQIDVIRMKPISADDDSPSTDIEPVTGGQMNEALGYLLRRLRDSRQGKAA